MNGSAGTSPAVASAALDKRRAKLHAARSADDAAAARVVQVDGSLAANAALTREHDASLQTLRDRLADLEKAIKADRKKDTTLRTERDRARRTRAKTQQAAAAAEAKYDQAVLADMLRREKEHDLSAHPESGSAPAPAGPAARPNTATRTARHPATTTPRTPPADAGAEHPGA